MFQLWIFVTLCVSLVAHLYLAVTPQDPEDPKESPEPQGELESHSPQGELREGGSHATQANMMQMPRYSLAELRSLRDAFDSAPESARILVAVYCEIFDVTDAKRFYHPDTGGYRLFAFRDGTRAMALEIYEEDLLDLSLEGLSERDMRSLSEAYWTTYRTKYRVVGTLSDPPYECAAALPEPKRSTWAGAIRRGMELERQAEAREKKTTEVEGVDDVTDEEVTEAIEAIIAGRTGSERLHGRAVVRASKCPVTKAAKKVGEAVQAAGALVKQLTMLLLE